MTRETTLRPLYVQLKPQDTVAIIVNEGGLRAGTRFDSGLTLIEDVPEAHKVFGPDGRVQDFELRARLREVGANVAEFARLHEAGRAQEFVRNWENAMENPGG